MNIFLNQAGGKFEEEGWNVKKDGSYFWASSIISPLHNKNGYVVMIRDLSEKRSMEQDHRANLLLTNSNKQLERFAFVTSHELKEPVRKIATFSNMLKEGVSNQSSLIDKIVVSCNRLTVLLDNIIELAFLTQPQPLIKEDLNVILHRALDRLGEEIKIKKVEIRYQNLPVAAVIPRQMEQLFQHLVSNAVKFSSLNNSTPVIIIEGYIIPKEALKVEELEQVKQSKRYLQIKVGDNGIGFDAKHSEKIFDLFSRLHGNSEYEGTGVGLTICKRVAENHGGNIGAFSEKGKGTLFYVNLPYHENY